MSEAPERIWAFMPDIFDNISVWQDQPSPALDTTEYIRADLARPKVKPLEWYDDDVDVIEAVGWGVTYSVMTMPSGKGNLRIGSKLRWVTYPTPEAAKAAAQEDYERRILAALY